MTTQSFQTVKVYEGDGITSTIQIPTSSAPTVGYRTVEINEGDGRTSTIQVPISSSISPSGTTAGIPESLIQAQLRRVVESGPIDSFTKRVETPSVEVPPTKVPIISTPSYTDEERAIRAIDLLREDRHNLEAADTILDLLKRGRADLAAQILRESKKERELQILLTPELQRAAEEVGLSDRAAQVLLSLKPDELTRSQRVIRSKLESSLSGIAEEPIISQGFTVTNIDRWLGDALAETLTGGKAQTTTYDEKSIRQSYKELEDKASASYDTALADALSKNMQLTETKEQYLGRALPLEDEYVAMVIANAPGISTLGKEIGLSLIPVYGTYRDTKRLVEEWDDLTPAERSRDIALNTLSAIGDATLIFGTGAKLTKLLLKGDELGTISMKAATDSVSEAVKIAENTKVASNIDPSIEVIANSNLKYLDNVANLSIKTPDTQKVFDIIIEPTPRGIRDAGVVDDVLKGKPEALEVLGRQASDAPLIQRNTQGVIEIDKPLTDIELKQLADAIRSDTEISSIKIRAIERPAFDNTTIENLVNQKMDLWKKQNPRLKNDATLVESVRAGFIEDLSKTYTAGRSTEQSAKLLETYLDIPSISQRSGLISSDLRQAITRRPIQVVTEVERSVPLKDPRIATKEAEIVSLRINFNLKDINPELVSEGELILSDVVNLRKLNKLEKEVDTLRKQDSLRKIETRSVRLEPQSRQAVGSSDDSGGGIAVLTKPKDVTDVRFSTGYSSIRTPQRSSQASAIGKIIVPDVDPFEFELEQPTAIPGSSPEPGEFPDSFPGPGPSDVPGPGPLILPDPTPEPGPEPEPQPEPEPEPQPEPQPTPDPTKVQTRTGDGKGRGRIDIDLGSPEPQITESKIRQEGIKGFSWKMGRLYVGIVPPFKQANIVYSPQIPPMTLLVSGPSQAWDSIKKLGYAIDTNTYDEWASWFAAPREEAQMVQEPIEVEIVPTRTSPPGVSPSADIEIPVTRRTPVAPSIPQTRQPTISSIRTTPRTSSPGLAWQMGETWIAVYPPFTEDDIVYGVRQPQNTEKVRGPKAAWGRIKRMGYEVPADTYDEWSSWFNAKNEEGTIVERAVFGDLGAGTGEVQKPFSDEIDNFFFPKNVEF